MARFAPNRFKFRRGNCRSSETTSFAVHGRAVLLSSPTLLAHTRPSLATMSDLCPVYAPFFGAMVGLGNRTRNFGRKALTRRFSPSSTRRVVPVPSCLHVCPLRCRPYFYPS